MGASWEGLKRGLGIDWEGGGACLDGLASGSSVLRRVVSGSSSIVLEVEVAQSQPPLFCSNSVELYSGHTLVTPVEKR